MFGIRILLATTALSRVSAQNLTTSDCCASLAQTTLKDLLLYPEQSDYQSRLASYFDVKQQSITPACILQPRTSQDVALAVTLLTDTSASQSCKFAIRSGGHTPIAGASNIEDGVTIDLKYMNTVEYDAENKLARVGAGATWNDVFTTLEPLGVITTGGRSSSVGVGGLTLGGGISYFSPEHGFICDNVLEFEVVLANGSITSASETCNPDLFTVLKGGNNNFGIVTRFNFRTFPYQGLWGGLVTYPGSTIEAHFKALVNFADSIEQNVKGAAIVIEVYHSTVGENTILNAYDYAEPIVRPAAYDEFLAIPGNTSDTTGLRNMSSLAQELVGSTKSRVYFGTLTFANDVRVMNKAHEIYMDVLARLKSQATGEWDTNMLYQPLPPAYWKHSVERGGNVLGFERFEGQVLCLYQPYMSWEGAHQDALFESAGAELIDRIRDYAENIGADCPYLYLDYAYDNQDPLASYGAENVEKMKAAAAKYDPSEVFQHLVPGGFKISKVS